VENGLTNMSKRFAYEKARAAWVFAVIVLLACGVGVASAAEPAPTSSTDVQEPVDVQAKPILASDDTETNSNATPTTTPIAPTVTSDQELALLRQDMRALHQEVRLLRTQLKQAEAPKEPSPALLSPLKRGNYYVGGTISLGYRSRDNYETLAGTVDDGRRFTTKFEGIAGYVLKTNALALGVSAAYRRTLSKGTISESDSEPNDRNSVEYDVRVGPAVRGFLPVDKAGRFFVYAQAAAVFGYGERVERAFTDTTSSVLSSNGFSMALTVQPGLMVAASKNFAFEVGVSVLGLEYQDYKATTNHTSEGREQNVDLSVDLNLLSLQFAFVGYF